MFISTRKQWGLAPSLRSACPRCFPTPANASRRSTRTAFTLVEMLVSMALILFIMVILSTAFTTGLQVFRQLKGLGDMEEHLRAASQILRRDLSAYHFENTRKLSDPLFWDQTVGGPPQQGFFRIWHNPVSSTTEGFDGDSLPSFRSTGDMLHFTSKLSGQGIGDFATSNVPNALTTLVAGAGDSRYQQTGQFRGRWYEVVYFLAPNGQAAAGNGAPLFTLYRRQLGILDTPGNVNPTLASQLNTAKITVLNGNEWANFSELACKKNLDIQDLNPPVSALYPLPPNADFVRFSSPADLTMPARRFGMLPAKQAGPNNQEMAGVPANPLIGLSNPVSASFPISGRRYPFLAELANIPGNNPWNLPPSSNAPFFGNPPPWQGNSSLQGADLLLSDVISFEVKVLVPGATDYSDISPSAMSNAVFSSANVGVFDTWSSQNDGIFDYSNWNSTGAVTSVPVQAVISALKITIRIWDGKTQQARQITIIQDM